MSQKRESWQYKCLKNRQFLSFRIKKNQKRELIYEKDQKTGRDILEIMNLSEGFMPFGEHRI